jgi:hypothetical protein
MMQRRILRLRGDWVLAVLASVVLSAASRSACSQEPPAAGAAAVSRVDYLKQVKPLLSERCYAR